MTLSDPYSGFKVMVFLKCKYLNKDLFYRQSYYSTLIENDRQAIKWYQLQ